MRARQILLPLLLISLGSSFAIWLAARSPAKLPENVHASHSLSQPPPHLTTAAVPGGRASPRASAPLAEFHPWAETYALTPLGDRPSLIAQGREIAAARRPLLAALIQADPEEALRQAVPMRLRQQLPPEILGRLEERVDDRGDFAVIAKEPLPGAPPDPAFRSIDRYARFGTETYYAHVYGHHLSQNSQEDIRLHGILLDGHMALHDDPEPSVQPATSWTTGIKTVLFMRLNFPDHLSESISEADAMALMHSTSNWFFEMSYGFAGLQATFTPLLTMPRAKSSYETNGNIFDLMSDARAAARAHGFETADFDRDVVHHPQMYPGASAFAMTGSKGVWLQATRSVPIAVHEFGHNYGLRHANAWRATGDTVIGPGAHLEYAVE